MTMTTRRRIGTFSLALLLGAAHAAVAQREARDDESAITDPRVQHRTYTMTETGETLPYALFVPTSYDGSEPYRLMVSLHGAGRQYDWLMGYAGFLDRAERDGYIVVTPLGYTRRGGYGYRGNNRPDQLAEKDVMTVVGMVRDEFNIDENRTYLWGHSMGGAGTYHLAARYPEIWAGLAVAAPARRADRQHNDVGLRHRFTDFGGEAQPAGLGVPAHQVIEAGLTRGDVEVTQPLDLLRVDINAADLVALRAEAGAGDQADVSSSDDRELHNGIPSLRAGPCRLLRRLY